MNLGDTVDATFYAQIEPEWTSYVERRTGEKGVRNAKMVRATQTRVTAKPGTVTVKLTVRLPKAAFYPLRPEAVIEIPAELISTAPIQVVAESPEEIA